MQEMDHKNTIHGKHYKKLKIGYISGVFIGLLRKRSAKMELQTGFPSSQSGIALDY